MPIKKHSMDYYDWNDVRKELCRIMNIKETQFRNYGSVTHPYDKNPPYQDCWHVWLAVWGSGVKNDSYVNTYFHGLSESDQLELDPGYEWATPFVDAVRQFAEGNNLVDDSILIHYSW